MSRQRRITKFYRNADSLLIHQKAVYLILIIGIRQKSNYSGSLDSLGQCTLMFGAIAGNTAGQYLTPFSYIFAQFGGIFIVDIINFIYTEAANPFTSTTVFITASGKFTVTSIATAASIVISHWFSSLFIYACQKHAISVSFNSEGQIIIA